ncbi:alpha-1B adrenergic receptor [Camelus ferus]|nr:alpha-1B adrenergic receptor [Camelus ferus]
MNPDLDTGHNTSAPAHWGELKNANFTGPNQTSSNSTLPQLDITRAISVGLVLGAFILFAIVGNILVILSVACNRHLRTPTNYFIVNLAIADLLLSFTVLPFSAALEVLGYWVLGRIFCDIWAAVDVLCCTASILSLCAISIDRYIGVRYSLQYPTLVTRRKAILALLSVWVLSTVISIGPLLGWKEPAPNDDKECGVTEEPFYALFSSLGSFYIPLAVILVMYCRVYIVAKRTTKNLEAGVMKEMSNSKELTLRIHSKNFHEDTLSSTKAKGHNPRSSIAVKLFKFSREKKAAKTLGIVVGMFILCWLPFFIALPLGSLFSALKPPDAVFKVVFWLGYFNSCLNPIIYPCSSKEFKRAFVRILGQERQRHKGKRHIQLTLFPFHSKLLQDVETHPQEDQGEEECFYDPSASFEKEEPRVDEVENKPENDVNSSELDEEYLIELEKNMPDEEKKGCAVFFNPENHLSVRLYGSRKFLQSSPSDVSILLPERQVYSVFKQSCCKDETAIQLNPSYIRAILRRAELYEKTDKLDEALEDYKSILEKDPSVHQAREACMRLPKQIEERNERLKEEMLGEKSLPGVGFSAQEVAEISHTSQLCREGKSCVLGDQVMVLT